MSDTTTVLQPVRPRRRSGFFYGLILGILLMLIFSTSPDKVVQNFHSWVNLFTTPTTPPATAEPAPTTKP